ncbi:MAG: hypothetical protein CMD18_04810 [Flavobacteriales bacterium]|nr:hypothetical protein [Flavobacteriales bacterium]
MDKLHFLVQSFTEEEKKGFEHFVNRFRVRENRKDLDLFHRLSLTEKLTQEEAFNILYEGLNEKEAYHALRKRLLGHLIEFISVKEINEQKGTTHYNSEGLLNLAGYLFDRDAYEPGWQYLKRAHRSESKKENYLLQSKIFMLWLENWEDYQGDEKFNSIYKAYVSSKDKAEKEQRLKLALSIVKRKIEQYKQQLKEIQIDAIIKDVTDGLELKKKDFHSVENLNYITKIIRSSSLVSKDYEGVESFLRTRIKKIDRKGNQDTHSFEYWELVYFYAHALYRLKKISKAREVLQEIELTKGNLQKSKKEDLFCKVELLKWACDFYDNQLNASIHRLLLHESGTPFEKNLVHDLDRKLNLITSFFASGEYSRGIGVIKSIKHSTQWIQKKKGLEFRVKFQLIELLYFLETGKIDLVIARIRSLKRIIKDVIRLNPNYKNLNVFLNVINTSVQQGSFKGLERELDKFHFTPFKRENIQAMAFYAYLKCKVKSEDYYKTLIDLVTVEWVKN